MSIPNLSIGSNHLQSKIRLAKSVIPGLFQRLNVDVAHASFNGEMGNKDIDEAGFERESEIVRDLNLEQTVNALDHQQTVREFFRNLNQSLLESMLPDKWAENAGVFGVITVFRDATIHLEINFRSIETVEVKY